MGITTMSVRPSGDPFPAKQQSFPSQIVTNPDPGDPQALPPNTPHYCIKGWGCPFPASFFFSLLPFAFISSTNSTPVFIPNLQHSTMESATERRNRLIRECRAARSVEQRAQDNEVRRARQSAFFNERRVSNRREQAMHRAGLTDEAREALREENRVAHACQRAALGDDAREVLREENRVAHA